MIGGEGLAARLGRPVSGPATRSRRTPAIDLNAAVAPYVGAAIVGLVVAILVLLVVAFLLARRIGTLRRRIDAITRGADGTSLDAILDAHLDKVFAVSRELDDLSARSAVLEAAGRHAIQRVG